MATPIHGKGPWSATTVPPRAHDEQPNNAQTATASRRAAKVEGWRMNCSLFT